MPLYAGQGHSGIGSPALVSSVELPTPNSIYDFPSVSRFVSLMMEFYDLQFHVGLTI